MGFGGVWKSEIVEVFENDRGEPPGLNAPGSPRPKRQLVIQTAQSVQKLASCGEPSRRARHEEPLADVRGELTRDPPGFVRRVASLLGLPAELAEVGVEKIVQAGEVLAADDRVQSVTRPDLLGEPVEALDGAKPDLRRRRLQPAMEQVRVDRRPEPRSKAIVDEHGTAEQRG
jgi:hypothetical protein